MIAGRVALQMSIFQPTVPDFSAEEKMEVYFMRQIFLAGTPNALMRYFSK